ncbi:MAG TPA: KEOPS complex subunit Pcc1 [Methanocorpusculum sp.]|nr:KEOPS complex subunit Pcc1 [Methanocorpusculum sp.]
MKVTGEIRLAAWDAEKLAASLKPDCAGYMECFADGDEIVAEFDGESLRTIISTVDDYLMNLSIAQRVNESLQ